MCGGSKDLWLSSPGGCSVHGQEVQKEGNEDDGSVQDVVVALPVGNGACVELQQKLGGVNSDGEGVCGLERGGSKPRQLPDPKH